MRQRFAKTGARFGVDNFGWHGSQAAPSSAQYCLVQQLAGQSKHFADSYGKVRLRQYKRQWRTKDIESEDGQTGFSKHIGTPFQSIPNWPKLFSQGRAGQL